MSRYGLEQHGITRPGDVHWNLAPPRLVEEIVRRGEGELTSTGAVNALTGKRTGRSPKDKFIVDELANREKIWWGKVNQPISEDDYLHLRQAVLSYLQGRELFVMDGFAGADSRYTVPIRVVTELAWHSLFARQLFRRATPEQLETHIPEWTVINACKFQVEPKKYRLNSEAFIIVDFTRKTVLIGGTQYAGEIKKSIFTVLNYLLPQKGVLPMHCSANINKLGDVALFFGLSGTGKTTLSADPNRRLIGDDEHGWSDQGVFNFEGGCYAKCIKLDREREPQIWDAIRFGAVIENVVIDPNTREANFDDASLTENTRCAYPLDYIANAEPSGRGRHPKAIIFLTCDAFGVFPAVARLAPEQAMYHFMSGYTAKVAGTEADASKDPSPTFSTCFGAPFLPLPPQVYAELLAKKMKQHGARCYLVNTGWIGNTFGVSPRTPLTITRLVISHILDGTVEKAMFRRGPVFGLEAPTKLPGVPAELLNPRLTAKDLPEYERRARDLAKKFVNNFEQFKGVSPESWRQRREQLEPHARICEDIAETGGAVVTDLPPIWQVFLVGLGTALATGLGALPFAFTRTLPKRWEGISCAVAAGMMTSAAVFSLADLGLRRGGVWGIVLGMLAGAAFFWLTARSLEGNAWHIAELSAQDSKRAVLIVATMFVHSIPEGIAIGVGYATADLRFGLLLAVAIAVHNVPEGIAVSLPLRAKGVSALKCAGWAIFTSIPQPVFAVPAFVLVSVFKPLMPFGLGLAGGAMIFIVASELLPESIANCTKFEMAWGFMLGLVLMLLLTSGLGL